MIRFLLPDELHRRVKSVAALRGQTLRAYVIEVLEQAVARAEQEQDKRRADS